MAIHNKQNVLIKLLPDLPPFRRIVSRMKITMARKYALSEKDVFAGESKESEKARVAAECEKKWPGITANVNRKVDETFEGIPMYRQMKREGNTSHLDKIREDMIFCFFAYGFTPNEYFAFRLERKEMQERKEFISDRMRLIFRCRMNNLLQASIFNDKTETYEYFKPYFRRDAIAVSEPSHYEKYREFVAAHPQFVKKAVFEAQGRGVEFVDSTSCGMAERELFDSIIAKGKHILEERIIQTSEMAAFNASSVNTVRAITFNTRHGIVVPYCTIRTGQPGSFIDNGGAGGVQACIDFETGKIITDGFDEFGGEFTAHPASKTVFKGYQFPDWEQLKELMREVASQLPLVKFIGWDLAHTEKGWIIVEGNESCYIIAKQMIQDRGMRSVFEKIMEDMDLII